MTVYEMTVLLGKFNASLGFKPTIGSESLRLESNYNTIVRSLGSVVTSLPTDQEVSSSVLDSAVGFFSSKNIFYGI